VQHDDAPRWAGKTIRWDPETDSMSHQSPVIVVFCQVSRLLALHAYLSGDLQPAPRQAAPATEAAAAPDAAGAAQLGTATADGSPTWASANGGGGGGAAGPVLGVFADQVVKEQQQPAAAKPLEKPRPDEPVSR